MTALTMGLVAAFCWGLHDITIRFLSRSAPMMACLLAVLLIGSVFQLTALILSGMAIHANPEGVGLAVAAGIAFLLANVGLYFAFARGPVRVVTPIIACFSVISVGIAILGGSTPSGDQGLAVLVLLAGITIVAVASPADAQSYPPLRPTILFAALAAFGFAFTFKLGQLAAHSMDELQATLLSRLTALLALTGIMVAKGLEMHPGRRAFWPLMGMGLLDSVAIYAVVSAAPLPNPEYAAVATSTFGLLTIVLAWALLKESLSKLQCVGCLLAFGAVGYLAL